MAAVDYETFAARWPELVKAGEELIRVELREAECDLDETAWGDHWRRGVGFLAAHRVALAMSARAGGSGSAGKIARWKSAGGVSSAYAVPQGLAPAEAAYYSTVYGQRFLEQRQLALGGPRCA